MRLLGRSTTGAAILLSATLSTALLVAPSSNCAVQCGNVLSSLSGDELTCSDSLYKSTVAGQTFQSCIACELNSTYVDQSSKQSDLQWLLYNLRYTVSYCLFGFPNNTNIANSPCITSFACGEIQNATEEYLDVNEESTYGYCDKWNTERIPKCQDCLFDSGNVDYLSNYITALSAGCQYKPASGQRLPISGSVFSSTRVNITDPAIPTNTPTFNSNTHGLQLGAKIGIAIGALVFLLILIGCIIVYRGKKKRRAYLAKFSHPLSANSSPLSANPHHEAAFATRFHDKVYSSPNAQSPESESGHAFMSWPHDDSPASATAGREKQFLGHGAGGSFFSPYNSNYSSPISPDVGRYQSQNLGSAGGMGQGDRDTRGAVGDYSSSGGGADGDVIEMAQLRQAEAAHMGFTATAQPMHHNVAPIIREPVRMHVRTSSNDSLPHGEPVKNAMGTAF